MDKSRIDRNRLVEQATDQVGADDFGESGWEEGLDILLGSMKEEARLNDLGMEIASGDITGYLANRLSITAWRRNHPDVAEGTIEQPIVIVGQPRTGTTILFDLLAQDPDLRAPLTWEVDRPVPPPETGSYRTDPRIDEVQATIELAESVMPGFTKFHPMGALLGQECVRITAADFRSMIFHTQYRVPTYNQWLLHEAELRPAYRWHRCYLQHLQSRHPTRQWLLKSPAHLWHMETLALEYPDAIIVQTHRDPLKVIASTSALVAHLRRMASDETSVAEVAPGYAEDIFVGLERGIEARDQHTFPSNQVIDVHFDEFVDDPLSTIRRLYGALDRELTGPTEDRMRQFLSSNPSDGGGGRYRFADTGLDASVLRERSKRYQERFGVASEEVS